MTKEKIILLLFIIMFVLAIVPTNVKATGESQETWTDLTNAKLEIIPVLANNQTIENATIINYAVRISNVTLNPTSSYSVYFHYEDEQITKTKVLSHSQATIVAGKNEGNISLFNLFLQYNKDFYVSIVEKKSDNNSNILITAKKIERPELLPKLGNRFHIFFSANNTSTYFFAPNVNKLGSKIDRTLKIKVGKVTDAELLNVIKNNKTTGLNQLLDYAKKVAEFQFVGTIKYEHSKNSGITESLTSKMNLTNGNYYFAYIELDNENGVYYPVEDIALYQAKGTSDLVRYSDTEFTWNIPEENKPSENNPNTPEQSKPEDNKPEQNKPTQNTPEQNKPQDTNKVDGTKAEGTIPQTGESIIYIIGLISICILTLFVYIKSKKYKDVQ